MKNDCIWKKSRIAWIGVACALLTACSAQPDVTDSPSEPESPAAETLSVTQPEQPMDYEEQAKTLLRTAFSFDAGGLEPEVILGGDMTSLHYRENENESFPFYCVDFREDDQYPMTLYYFAHSNEVEQVHLENDPDFQFPTEMVDAAKAFVKRVYGVDCAQAEVSAYGYVNKISVQLAVSEQDIFQVRFYYQDMEPVGVLYFTDAEFAQAAMDTNHAVQYAVE